VRRSADSARPRPSSADQAAASRKGAYRLDGIGRPELAEGGRFSLLRKAWARVAPRGPRCYAMLAAPEPRRRCAWCIMVRTLMGHRVQGCGAIESRPKASSPLIVSTIALSDAIVLEAVKVWPGKGGAYRKAVRRRAPTWAERGPARGNDSDRNKETDPIGRCARRDRCRRRPPS
jgi:hypothetical protein